MKKHKILIVIACAVIVGFMFYWFGLLGSARNIFYAMVRPLSIASREVVGKPAGFFSNLFHLGSIVKQNSNLISENLEFQSQLAHSAEIEYENEILKKELGFFKGKETKDIIPALVISRPASGYVKTIIIDKGEKDGIEEGLAVLSQGFIVGTIGTVYNDSAEVKLATDFNSLIPVILQESRGTGLLRGGLNGLIAEDIPLNTGIKPKENVVTSGLGGKIPAGIIAGTVLNVISKEGEIFQRVSVLSPIDFSHLQVLSVVRPESGSTHAKTKP